MTIAGVEGHPGALQKLKLGIDGADEEIENTKWAIEALGKAGIQWTYPAGSCANNRNRSP
jgi:hypothetical protein